MSDTKIVISVWSSYGHRFMSTDVENHESCLTCGAMFELTPEKCDDPEVVYVSGRYHAANGDDPNECTGDTRMAHGYSGERVCECEEGCNHCEHDCNCLFCA